MPSKGIETGSRSEAPQWLDVKPPPPVDKFVLPATPLVEGDYPLGEGNQCQIGHAFQMSPAWAFGTCPLQPAPLPGYQFIIGFGPSFNSQGFKMLLYGASIGLSVTTIQTAPALGFYIGEGSIYANPAWLQTNPAGPFIPGPQPTDGNCYAASDGGSSPTPVLISRTFGDFSAGQYQLNGLGDGSNTFNDTALFTSFFQMNPGATLGYLSCQPQSTIPATASTPLITVGGLPPGRYYVSDQVNGGVIPFAPPANNPSRSYYINNGSGKTTVKFYAVPMTNPSNPMSGNMGEKVLISTGSYNGGRWGDDFIGNNVQWVPPLFTTPFDSFRAFGPGVYFQIYAELQNCQADFSLMSWQSYGASTSQSSVYGGGYAFYPGENPANLTGGALPPPPNGAPPDSVSWSMLGGAGKNLPTYDFSGNLLGSLPCQPPGYPLFNIQLPNNDLQADGSSFMASGYFALFGIQLTLLAD